MSDEPDAAADEVWLAQNQRYLQAALGRMRALIDSYTQRRTTDDAADDASRAIADATAALRSLRTAMVRPPALEQLATAFGLSQFERDLLLLCAGVELDTELQHVCAIANGLSTAAHQTGAAPPGGPTFSLALAALPGTHWSATLPLAPLRRHRLLHVDTRDSLLRCPLLVSERVLHFLTGLSYLDEALAPLLKLVTPGPGSVLTTSHQVLAARITHFLNETAVVSDDIGEQPLVQLCTGDLATALSVMAHAAVASGRTLYRLDPGNVPSAASERHELAQLWTREARLTRAVMVLQIAPHESAETVRAAVAMAELLVGPLFLISREPLPLVSPRQSILRLELPPLSAAERRAQWQELLPAEAPPQQLEQLAAHFHLNGVALRSVAASARLRQRTEGVALTTALWQECRAHARGPLDELAQRITPAATWADLILPEEQIQTLRDIVAQVRARTQVYDDWGYSQQRGQGISVLFAGSSGTGKTLAAEVLAGALELDLYRIDLSQVISKYIGETEKNLRRVFDAADQSGAMLLFDEADALFGKRSEVKDSHDRYANIEVSYLLQQMESYRGLAILTTNLKGALDVAFLRRLRFVVQFPFPESAQRLRLWQRAFPKTAPTDALDLLRLSRWTVAGGHIRNISLNAAFLAAAQQEPVRMHHLIRAARSEYEKLGKPFDDLGGGGTP